jgi:hypothetical protein
MPVATAPWVEAALGSIEQLGAKEGKAIMLAGWQLPKGTIRD